MNDLTVPQELSTSGLVPVFKNEQGTLTVNARDLWVYLEVQTKFSVWVQRRIEEYGFAQGVDFTVIPIIGNNPQGGAPTKEYHISLSMAKELAMVEKTLKGKEARLYFIACEKQLQLIAQPLSLDQHAKVVLDSWLGAAELLGVPLHIAQQEAIKATVVKTGVDYSPLLLSAPAQDNIPKEDIMLEPTALAKYLGVKSGAAINLLLEEWGLQTKFSGVWKPTEEGKSYCVRHAWKKGAKSGYNRKWKVSHIEALYELKKQVGEM